MADASQTALQSELDSQRRKVDVDHYDVTVRELVSMAAAKELVMAPTYQRKFRWSSEDEGRLIESVLLGLPVPPVFVAANENGTWELVDGLQRISSLIHFVADPPELLALIGKPEPLALGSLEKLPSFSGMTCARLPGPMRLHFLKRALRVTVLSDKSDFDVRFDLFERLNSGGVALTEQEVRACIYRGKFIDFLRELAANEDFGKLVKLQVGKEDDGTREELVLKFFAYLHGRETFKGRVKDFLNVYVESNRDHFDYDEARDLFSKTVHFVYEAAGGPLLRVNYANTPLNQCEGVLVGVAEIFLAGTVPTAPTGDWLNDPELIEYSTKGTNTRGMLAGRISRAKALFGGIPPAKKRATTKGKGAVPTVPAKATARRGSVKTTKLAKR